MAVPSSSSRAPTAAAPALVPQGAHAGKPFMPLGRPVTVVGSRNRSHLHLLSRSISKSHALIVNSRDGVYVRDLASRAHVYVNGRQIKEADLRDGDILKIGSFTFQFTDKSGQVLPTAANAAPAAELDFVGAEPSLRIPGRAMLIGRRPTCDLALSELSVSTTHAVIFELNGRRFIRDLGSRTGTWVNAKNVHQDELEFGDKIRIGDTQFRYAAASGEELDELEDLVGTATLSEDSMGPPAIGEAGLAEQEPVDLEPLDEAETVEAEAVPEDEAPVQRPQLPPTPQPSRETEERIPVIVEEQAAEVPPPEPDLLPLQADLSAVPMPPALAPAEPADFIRLDADNEAPVTSADTAAIPLVDEPKREKPVLSPALDEAAGSVDMAADEQQLLVDADIYSQKSSASGTFADLQDEADEAIAFASTPDIALRSDDASLDELDVASAADELAAEAPAPTAPDAVAKARTPRPSEPAEFGPLPLDELPQARAEAPKGPAPSGKVPAPAKDSVLRFPQEDDPLAADGTAVLDDDAAAPAAGSKAASPAHDRAETGFDLASDAEAASPAPQQAPPSAPARKAKKPPEPAPPAPIDLESVDLSALREVEPAPLDFAELEADFLDELQEQPAAPLLDLDLSGSSLPPLPEALEGVEVVDKTEPTPESALDIDQTIQDATFTPAAEPEAALSDTNFGDAVKDFAGDSIGPLVEATPEARDTPQPTPTAPAEAQTPAHAAESEDDTELKFSFEELLDEELGADRAVLDLGPTLREEQTHLAGPIDEASTPQDLASPAAPVDFEPSVEPAPIAPKDQASASTPIDELDEAEPIDFSTPLEELEPARADEFELEVVDSATDQSASPEAIAEAPEAAPTEAEAPRAEPPPPPQQPGPLPPQNLFRGMARDQASFLGGMPLVLPELSRSAPFGQVPVTFAPKVSPPKPEPVLPTAPAAQAPPPPPKQSPPAAPPPAAPPTALPPAAAPPAAAATAHPEPTAEDGDESLLEFTDDADALPPLPQPLDSGDTGMFADAPDDSQTGEALSDEEPLDLENYTEPAEAETDAPAASPASEAPTPQVERPAEKPKYPTPPPPARGAARATPPRSLRNPFEASPGDAPGTVIPPFAGRTQVPSESVSTAFDGLALAPAREVDVFSQTAPGVQAPEVPEQIPDTWPPEAIAPAPGQHGQRLSNPFAAAERAKARPQTLQPLERRGNLPHPPAYAPPEFDDAAGDDFDEGPVPPRRRTRVIALVIAMIVCALGAAGGIYYFVPTWLPGRFKVEGSLAFDRLNDLRVEERQKFQVQQKNNLRDASVRQVARDILQGDPRQVPPGFLGNAVSDGLAFEKVIEAARLQDNRNALLLSRQGNEPGDDVRMLALLKALYNHPNNMKLKDAADRLAAQKKAAEDELSGLTHERATYAKLAEEDQLARAKLPADPARTAAELKKEADRLTDIYREKLRTAQDVDTPAVPPAPDSSAPATAPAAPTAASIAADPQILEWSQQLKELRTQLDEAKKGRGHQVSAAADSLDQAVRKFEEQIAAARKTLTPGRSQFDTYLTAAKLAADKIRELNGELLEQQKSDEASLTELQRVTALKNSLQISQAMEGDDHLRSLLDDRAVKQRQRNAADGQGLTAQAEQLKNEVASLDSKIQERRNQLGAGASNTEDDKTLQGFVDDSLKRTEQARSKNDKAMQELLKNLSTAKPLIEQLPDEQKTVAKQVDERTADLNKAREKYAQALAAANVGPDKAVKQLENNATQIAASIDARKKELAAVRAPIPRNPPERKAADDMLRQQREKRMAAIQDASEKAMAATRAANDAELNVARAKEAEGKAAAHAAQVAMISSRLQEARDRAQQLQDSLAGAVVPVPPGDTSVHLAEMPDPRWRYLSFAEAGILLVFGVLLLLSLRGRADNAYSDPGNRTPQQEQEQDATPQADDDAQGDFHARDTLEADDEGPIVA